MPLVTMILLGQPERLRVFPPCPPGTPKRPGSPLQMLAIAWAMAAICTWTEDVLTRLLGAAEKLSASEASSPCLQVDAQRGSNANCPYTRRLTS